MPTPYELVSTQFALAKTYADQASAKTDTFTSALQAATYAAPAISVTWVDPTLGALPAMPGAPTAPTISFDAPTVPTDLSLTDPTITLATFTEAAPTLAMPDAPTVSYGMVPTIPDITSPTIPSAPTLASVSIPSLLTLSTPTFAGVNLPSAVELSDIPTLSLVAPTPYSYSVGEDYASTMLTSLQSVLNTRLAGGTGLAPAVEQAIWDRSRSRERATAAV